MAGIKLVSEIGGRLIADFRVTPDTIVKHLDVFKNHLPGVFTRGEAIVMQAFGFQCAKETFHRRIAPQGQATRSQQFPFRLIDVCMP